ncbi:sodium/potassium-transporting ATPase subunit alpha [Skeletonema marinoi]|uniref:Sodium/potassium-transporting ATPase subunit alpha n=1 Tax=Skeletonema marinoi TaxID=267567 RepID=A0AAD9D992_9STRA|nr:sodium/potassium-transporting ATPase subunit alpha [Skeletonema marinoi]
MKLFSSWRKRSVDNEAKNNDDLKRNVQVTAHKETIEELTSPSRLNVNPHTGLDADDAKQRLVTHGMNMLTPPKQTPAWIKFLKELSGFFSLLLWGGALLCFVGYSIDGSEDHLFLGIVLVVVVVVTGIFSFVQNSKSESLMNSFKSMLPPKVKVLRVERQMKLFQQDCSRRYRLCGAGDLIPADIRVLECSDNFQVDNAALTGESEPQKRSSVCTHDDPLETTNLCFFGTLAPEGSCKQFIGIGTPFIESLVFTIGIIVANVPEGLLATVTVCLTLTAKRMHAKKVLVKNLEGVETLGSTSCICSDKTGTLTMNVMTVAQVVYGGLNAFITEDAPSSFTGGKKTYDTTNLCFQKLLRCAALCNVATFTEGSKWKYKMMEWWRKESTLITGSRLECYESSTPRDEYDVDSIRSSHPVKYTIPFNSKNKYQVHVHEDTSSGRHLVLMKGAPERILDRCTHAVIGGMIVELDENERINIIEQQEALSANGLRCLGFAEKELDTNVYNNEFKYAAENDEFYSCNFPIGDAPSDVIDSHGKSQNPQSTGGLVFLGMFALIDPPRPAVPGAVKRCQTAGIKVIMVTGDHPVTAQAIAFKCGILWSKTRGDMIKDNIKFGRTFGSADYENPDDAEAIVVPGSELSPGMKESDWDFILNHRQVVFARTSPQQKLIIVENCQRLGHIVAVTGDGVNDSPAIKKADIGIAMGMSGSEVSKQAADMILLDDDFGSIVNGKSIAYTIQSNIPEITPFLAFIIFAIPLPLTTFLILAIDLGTDMIPAISMASEQPEADIMQRRPRTKSDRLVTPAMIQFSYGYIGMIQALAGFFTYMVVMNDYGYKPQILFNRGNSDAFGHQPFFCKFSGGHYANLAGTSMKGYDGKVVDCGYAYNDFLSDGSPTLLFDFRNSETYTETNGKHTATIESYEAMEQNHYFEYIPWRGRTSSYWDDSMLFHNTIDVNKGGNLAQNTNTYFRGRAAGLWSLCEQTSDPSCENQFCGDRGSAIVRGVEVPAAALNADPSRFSTNCTAQTAMTSNLYDNALYCNGQGNSCGQLTDEPETLPFCDSDGNVCGAFNDKAVDCSYMCEGYCYWPGSNAVNPNTSQVSSFTQFKTETPGSSAKYQQCVNIGSQEAAHEALRHAQGAFFVSIVIGQIAGLLVCKTRWLSIKSQGMQNKFMLFGIGTEVMLVLFLCYCEPLNVGLGTRNLRLVHFFPAIPFAILIVCFDEARKALMRMTSRESVDPISGQKVRGKGWIERNFGY